MSCSFNRIVFQLQYSKKSERTSRFFCSSILFSNTVKLVLAGLGVGWYGVTHGQEVIIPEPAAVGISNTLDPNVKFGEKNQPSQEVQLTDEQLSANPLLLAQTLDAAIQQHKWSIAAHLLPLYAQVSPRDETLLSFARARLAHARGQYAQAIDAYRAILADKPTLTPIRLYLAQALFENQQNEAAVFQFEKIRADQPPVQVLQTVEQYLTAIRRRNAWRVDGWLNYLNDDNVNNASKQQVISVDGRATNLMLTPDSLPKKAQGLGYGVNVARDVYVSDQNAITGSVSVNGKSYWNQHAYDDVIARANLGYQRQTARYYAAAVPFYQQRWFGNRAYSHTYGVRLSGSYIVQSDWQVGGAYEYGRNRYDERRYLDGDYHFVSLSASHAFNSTTQGVLGMDLTRDQAQDASDSSWRTGVRAGVTHDFTSGFSAQLQGSVARKRFDEPNFFGVRRQEREYNGTLTLWNRRWYVWGVMPKLNFEAQKTTSNISLYAYQKQRVYLSLDRRF